MVCGRPLETKAAESEFSSRASNVAFTLQTGLNEYLSKIVALRALFEAADHRVTRAEFQIFADRILQDQPAILSMSWIPRVSRDERFAHEQAAAQDGISNYRIRSVGSDGKLTVSTEQHEYFPVYYTTERDHPHAIYGLDLGDDGMREETPQRPVIRTSSLRQTALCCKLAAVTVVAFSSYCRCTNLARRLIALKQGAPI